MKQIADDCWGGVVSTIELDRSAFDSECTLGLSEYSHAEIIFSLDRIPEEKVERGARHPRGRMDWPRVGIFAQRHKGRPNRIGVTVCKIESVKGLKIRVRELDAIDGTPVLDVKPYLKEFAPRGGKVRQPAWAKSLMAGYFRRV